MQCLGCITKCFIFNAAIPQMEVFITYLYPDIICRGWLGARETIGGWRLHITCSRCGGGAGTVETWRASPLQHAPLARLQ